MREYKASKPYTKLVKAQACAMQIAGAFVAINKLKYGLTKYKAHK